MTDAKSGHDADIGLVVIRKDGRKEYPHQPLKNLISKIIRPRQPKQKGE